MTNVFISITPPQVGAYMSYLPSLLHIDSTRDPLRDLVNISVNWSLELTKPAAVSPKRQTK